ncbi:uncharacterized protein [Neodiprion pinetum]|uniref:uncharacterized protein LOC124183034 isoform X1 n=1 Tax=Neodiprion fabricii TaxID=2872261 RepID=UPI001ED925D3|nr:uncharacterized protein LOC124183034 isoform X1 [Neodiprion fabricii]XP_046483876.1 uncharacterized protein LOC124219795 isoform X1 [Neodiprion pinetum]XP_046620883.1 uncharacterized protein LOC124305455 isoform X1 [Neodiprion virginianus]
MGKKAEIGETCAKRPIRRSKSAGSSLLRLILISLAGSARSLQQRTNANTVLPAAKGTTEGPLKISIGKTASSGSSNRVPEYVCPGNELLGLARIFSVPCETDSECVFLGADQRCCKLRCRKGVLAPPREPEHRAVLGVNRMCPKGPVPELLPVKRCEADIECEEEGRICCPDKDFKLYCRTAAPVWSQLPFPRAHAAIMSLMEYMQCQMAPPPVLDLFPQPCNRTIECLPNLCCQEGPSKFCRPPRKSVLALVAQATQRFARG